VLLEGRHDIVLENSELKVKKKRAVVIAAEHDESMQVRMDL